MGPTMTVIIDLTPDQEARLGAFASSKGMQPAELATKLITDQLPSYEPNVALSPEERIIAMDALAEKNRGLPHVTDAAFDRENLYDERF